MRQANPQGKGVVPLLDSWQALRPVVPRPRAKRDVLLDYLVGLLVLSARFSFKPVTGQSYFLYWRAGDWILSLISPPEWGDRCPGVPVGEATLREDRSWQLQPHENVREHSDLVAALDEFQEDFIKLIDDDRPLEQGFPYHVASLPWYPRLLALALSRSLSLSLAQMNALEQTGSSLLSSVKTYPQISQSS